jgi:D-tyrosyl-tRNA(Tyr) deacylase
MRAVVQRVKKAQVNVSDVCVGKINKGILALVGFQGTDDAHTIDYMLDKILNLRIFNDEEDKMNLSLKDIEGDLLIVPNFTLYGECRKGRRPGYSQGATVNEAKEIFDSFIKRAKEMYPKVEQGQFQAEMEVSLINDGPITLLLDSDRQF